MNLRHSALALLVATFPFAPELLAQEPAATTQPPAAQAPPLPAAESPEATALVDKALAKMLAYGRGTFKTTEQQDSAVLRNAGLPFGNEDIEVEGGWHRGLLWGEHDGSEFLRANGRMLAKVGENWQLRGKKLGDGKVAPFTLDPDLLFTVLAGLPAEARKVVHVEAGEVTGKKVAVLSLHLTNEAASEFAESGAIPGGSGGGLMMLGGPPGMGAPEVEHDVYVALFLDAEGGDLLRCSLQVFEKNPMMGNIQIQVQGGGGDDVDEPEDKKEDAKTNAGDAPQWKKGLPVKKPAKDESVTTFRADFKKLGMAEAPALADKQKALLRL
jgi:hypothetical protein